MALSRRGFLTGQRRTSTPNGFTLPWWRHQPGCDGCARCVDACDTQIIVLLSGSEPQIDFSQGECTFCGACADACPQPLFTLRDAQPWPLRIKIDKRCIAFQGVNCRSCQESCEQQAITFHFNRLGVAQPEVHPENCTGCGACIAPCPVSATGLAHA